MRTVSFKTLMEAFAGYIGVDRTLLQANEERQLGAYLNEAALWLWESETGTMALPDMMVGKTVTLATGGVITAADIEDASFWNVWQADPRLQQSFTVPHYRRQASQLENGDIKVFSAAAGEQVFVFYKSAVPQWTVERLNSGLNYAPESVFWFEGTYEAPPTAADGHVYQNISGEELAGWDDWDVPGLRQKITLPQSLQRIVQLKANYERVRRGAAMPQNASSEEADLRRALDQALISVSNEVNGKPWLYNQNQ
jgi:hypothetical protein